MKEELYISGSCFIRDNSITINGNTEFELSQDEDFGSFLKSAYKQLKINYPKFYKMDNLCKLAIVTSDALLRHDDFDKYYKGKYQPEDIGVIISNCSSSLDTDIKFQETIKDENNYFPSPAVFVYTLPNILVGEISIKNDLKVENAFFISEKFDPEFLQYYVNNLFEEGKIKACITGWVECLENSYESFLLFIEKFDGNDKKDKIEFNVENINKIYN